MKNNFTTQLLLVSKIFEPFIYSEGAKAHKKYFVPHALMWWSKLINTAYLIEYADCPLSEKQLTYLKGTFFGGMGSFLDFSFSQKEIGKQADSINEKLDRERKILFENFKNIQI